MIDPMPFLWSVRPPKRAVKWTVPEGRQHEAWAILARHFPSVHPVRLSRYETETLTQDGEIVWQVGHMRMRESAMVELAKSYKEARGSRNAKPR